MQHLYQATIMKIQFENSSHNQVRNKIPHQPPNYSQVISLSVDIQLAYTIIKGGPHLF